MTVERLDPRPEGPVLLFRRPEGDHRKLIWGMRALMVLAVFSSLRNIWDLMGLLGDAWAVTDEINAILAQDQTPEHALLRDYSLFFQSVVTFTFLVTAVAFIGLIVRYVVLWFEVPKGHPRTYQRLRFWAALLVIVELLMALMWGYAALEEYEQLSVSRAFNPLALVGIVMLILLAFRPYKTFYSQYRIESAADAPRSIVQPTEPGHGLSGALSQGDGSRGAP